MDVGAIAAASTQQAVVPVQQAAQISLLKQANDNSQNMVARLLASAQLAPVNPPGMGTLVDRRA